MAFPPHLVVCSPRLAFASRCAVGPATVRPASQSRIPVLPGRRSGRLGDRCSRARSTCLPVPQSCSPWMVLRRARRPPQPGVSTCLAIPHSCSPWLAPGGFRSLAACTKHLPASPSLLFALAGNRGDRPLAAVHEAPACQSLTPVRPGWRPGGPATGSRARSTCFQVRHSCSPWLAPGGPGRWQPCKKHLFPSPSLLFALVGARGARPLAAVHEAPACRSLNRVRPGWCPGGHDDHPSRRTRGCPPTRLTAARPGIAEQSEHSRE